MVTVAEALALVGIRRMELFLTVPGWLEAVRAILRRKLPLELYVTWHPGRVERVLELGVKQVMVWYRILEEHQRYDLKRTRTDLMTQAANQIAGIMRATPGAADATETSLTSPNSWIGAHGAPPASLLAGRVAREFDASGVTSAVTVLNEGAKTWDSAIEGNADNFSAPTVTQPISPAALQRHRYATTSIGTASSGQLDHIAETVLSRTERSIGSWEVEMDDPMDVLRVPLGAPVALQDMAVHGGNDFRRFAAYPPYHLGGIFCLINKIPGIHPLRRKCQVEVYPAF